LILPSYTVELIVTQYLWIWISAFFMLLLYTIMFLLMRGWIGKKGAKRSGQLDHALDTIGQPGVGEDLQLLEAARTKRVAKKML
jgi:hypothetical protein